MSSGRRSVVLALALCLAACVARAYYIPGSYPREFAKGDEVNVEVNSLVSYDTELPYDYYYLPFCKPEGGPSPSKSSVNPGTILSGLRMFNSPYNFKVMERARTQTACPEASAGKLKGKEVKTMKDMIRNHYRVRMSLDNMPVTTLDLAKGVSHLKPGYELGVTDNGKDFYIFNHLVFNVLVHRTTGEVTRAQNSAFASSIAVDASGRRLLAWPRGTPTEVVDALRARSARQLAEEDDRKETEEDEDDVGDREPEMSAKERKKKVRAERARKAKAQKERDVQAAEAHESMWMVVGFEVMPCSIKRVFGDPLEDINCAPWSYGKPEDRPEPQPIAEGMDIVYTFDVSWEESDVEWASRWDAYLRMPDGSVHWFSILNSLLVVLVMSVIVAVILMRTVRRDLAKYEELLIEGPEAKEESGWKLVSGDVFRAPPATQDLAVQFGSGVQIFSTFAVTIVLASAGFLSPASRGALLTCAIVLYLLLAVTAGYAAVWLWANATKSLEGWTGVCLKTACYFPGILMLTLTLLNIMIASTGTIGAIPFTMYFSLAAIWFVVSIPLTYVGGFFAVKTPLLSWPTRTNQIPRHIPAPPTAADPYVLYAAAGILPFCTVFIELYFAMTSMWQGYFYYLFGFLFIVAVLTVLITMEVAVLCTYVQLCAEDYRWWWRSFHRGGAIGAYLLVYALVFLFNNLTAMHGLSVVLYLSYMVVVVLAIHLCMGAVGFASSMLFVSSIFNAVKAD